MNRVFPSPHNNAMTEPARFNNVVSFPWAIADLLSGAFQKSKVDPRPASMSNPTRWATSSNRPVP